MVAIAALCVLAAVAGAWLRTSLDTLRDPAAPMPRLLRLFEPVRFVATHPVLFTLATCSFVFSAVQVCVTSYSVTFLTHDLRWTLVAAGGALAVAQVAGVVGRIAWGVVADRQGDARPVLLALAVAMALCGAVAAVFDAASAHLGVIALLAIYGATRDRLERRLPRHHRPRRADRPGGAGDLGLALLHLLRRRRRPAGLRPRRGRARRPRRRVRDAGAAARVGDLRALALAPRRAASGARRPRRVGGLTWRSGQASAGAGVPVAARGRDGLISGSRSRVNRPTTESTTNVAG